MKKRTAIGEVIRAEVAAYRKHPYDINCGECEEFAEDVIARLGGYREGLTETSFDIETLGESDVIDLPGHIWIKCDGLHYDAEEPAGVEDWRDLPIFARLRRVPCYEGALSKTTTTSMVSSSEE